MRPQPAALCAVDRADANHRTAFAHSEISQKDFNAQDTKGPRSFSRFLLKITELSPRVVLKQISLLLTHLDSEVRRPSACPTRSSG